MSALPPIADIRQRIEHVCSVPTTDMGEGSETCQAHSLSSDAAKPKRAQQAERGLNLAYAFLHSVWNMSAGYPPDAFRVQWR
jgi:hypothetical protein